MFLSFTDKHAEKRSLQAVSSDRPIRSLAKAISWRVTGSIDTILLSWLFTGNLTTAAAIGLTEVATKMVLYYLHERAWNRIPLGRSEVEGQRERQLAHGHGVTHAMRPVPESE
jgi:uncharacterized membrane protein